MNKRRWLKRGFVVGVVLVLGFLAVRYSTRVNLNFSRSIGEPLDSLDGVVVYYNGGVNQSHGRNTAADGYNVGIRYQCVEFVKRYYWGHFQHRMPDSYGHAKDFFDPEVGDDELNPARGLRQFKNGSTFLPHEGDILVWGPGSWNPYGHVAIVSRVTNGSESKQHAVEYVQQNAGPFGSTRAIVRFRTDRLEDGRSAYWLEDDRVLGWLRMPR